LNYNISNRREVVLTAKIDTYKERIDKVRDMYLSDKLDEEDFRSIKQRYSRELEDLEYNLSVLKASDTTNEIHTKMEKAINGISDISERYKHADTDDKRAIIGLMYPEITFTGTHFQTPRMNSFAEYIFLIKKNIGAKKNGHQNFLNSDDHGVTSTGFKPVTF
jgi:site-specific DNA recombinase